MIYWRYKLRAMLGCWMYLLTLPLALTDEQGMWIWHHDQLLLQDDNREIYARELIATAFGF